MNAPLSQSREMACILVVENEYLLLKSLEGILSDQGYYVTCASGGAQACEYLATRAFDLMLLDLNMPGMSGHEVMSFISKKEIEVATIVISGETSFSSVSKALRRGAYDYLKKPYKPEELLIIVKRALKTVMQKEIQLTIQTDLQKSETLYRYIVNSSPDIVFMLNYEGSFTFINDKIESTLGYKKAELIGRHYQTIVDPLDLERANVNFKEQFDNKNSSRVSEIRLKPKNPARSTRYFELESFPIERPVKRTNGADSDTSGELKVIGTYGVARDISERKEAEQFIHFQAYHDMLTRLPNRELFRDRIQISLTQAKRNGRNLAVMFLDLNGFKAVNDSLGHSVGDRLLQLVALRIESCIRKCDTVSRFGGDEFTLLLPVLSSPDDARIIADKISTELKAPFMLAGHEIIIGASIGIAVYPGDGSNLEQLIQNADIAMYRAKALGKGGYEYFNKLYTA